MLHMKAFKKIMALALMGVMSLSVVACGGKSGDNRKPGGYDPTEKGEDGWAYNDTVDETVTEIEIFKNDWAVFNNARSANSPVYSKIKSEVGFDIKAMNSSSNWQQQLGLMQAKLLPQKRLQAQERISLSSLTQSLSPFPR